MQSLKRTDNSVSRMRKGFTIIEILIVIAVLGILGTLGYKKFSSVMDEAKIKQIEDEINFLNKAIANTYGSNVLLSKVSNSVVIQKNPDLKEKFDIQGGDIYSKNFAGVSYEINSTKSDSSGNIANIGTAAFATTDTISHIIISTKVSSQLAFYGTKAFNQVDIADTYNTATGKIGGTPMIAGGTPVNVKNLTSQGINWYPCNHTGGPAQATTGPAQATTDAPTAVTATTVISFDSDAKSLNLGGVPVDTIRMCYISYLGFRTNSK